MLLGPASSCSSRSCSRALAKTSIEVLGHVGCAAVSVDGRGRQKADKELRRVHRAPAPTTLPRRTGCPPLRLERRLFLSRRQNAFFKHGGAQLFCAWRDRRVVEQEGAARARVGDARHHQRHQRDNAQDRHDQLPAPAGRRDQEGVEEDQGVHRKVRQPRWRTRSPRSRAAGPGSRGRVRSCRRPAARRTGARRRGKQCDLGRVSARGWAARGAAQARAPPQSRS